MKIALCLLLLCFVGCARSSWQHTSIRSGNTDYDISKLTHPSSNPTDGLELELTRCGKEIHGYLNVHALELPSHEEDPHATTLTIRAQCASKTFVIPLLQGGQRARLTDTCLDYLLQTLSLKPSVTLSSGHFSETLDSANFDRHYNALLREPNWLKPDGLIHFELF